LVHAGLRLPAGQFEAAFRKEDIMNRAMPLFPLLGLTFVAVFCWAAEPDLLDPNLSYQAVRTNPVTYDAIFRRPIDPVRYGGRLEPAHGLLVGLA
jgi:hypothetical protein